ARGGRGAALALTSSAVPKKSKDASSAILPILSLMQSSTLIVLAVLSSDVCAAQSDRKRENHPDGGERDAWRCVRNLCGYCVAALYCPIERTLQTHKRHHCAQDDK